MAEACRIPLTVVGGFLGAGKTTVVNRILGGVTGIRAAVLVNDFGSVNIDAALIAAHRGETIALTNGCVCCSIGGDLTEALIRVMSGTPAPEWIVIEASGVSDPWRIAQVGLVDPGLELDGVIVLVDAAAFREHAADPLLRDTLLGQLAAADVLVINKRDLVSDAALRTLRNGSRRLRQERRFSRRRTPACRSRRSRASPPPRSTPATHRRWSTRPASKPRCCRARARSAPRA